ncbi:hypothetical protein XA68_16313 [Ophiocordyceps unilateralis]|uniref:Uncharacterized protein n=1 Tax=Ophiocordyceps unilateralis TaxID=268505 RepID=A0A2A9PKN2_OPHUN|nr:hypothetical protein XA68_16313 [Ophiocordyceps unilateralis]
MLSHGPDRLPKRCRVRLASAFVCPNTVFCRDFHSPHFLMPWPVFPRAARGVQKVMTHSLRQGVCLTEAEISSYQEGGYLGEHLSFSIYRRSRPAHDGRVVHYLPTYLTYLPT